MTYHVPCRHCHLLIWSPYYMRDTVCDYCAKVLAKRAEDQERLDRQNERHHT